MRRDVDDQRREAEEQLVRMNVLPQVQQLLGSVIDLGNEECSFEECFENILSFLIRETEIECGCILAEFENVNRIACHCEKTDVCISNAIGVDDRAATADPEIPSPNKRSMSFGDLDSAYSTILGEYGEDSIIYPLFENKEMCGVICLRVGSQGGEVTERIEIISSIILPFIEKLFNEKRSNLQKSYYSLEARVASLVHAGSDFNLIPTAILEGVGLSALILLAHDRKLSRVEVVAGEAGSAASSRHLIENLHLDLRSNARLRGVLEDIQGPQVFSSQEALDLLLGAETAGVAGNIRETLSTLRTGELLLSPSGNSTDNNRLVLAAVKKDNHVFVKSQISTLQKLARDVSTAVDGHQSKHTDHQTAIKVDLIQRISRRIIDDSDIDGEAEIIRQECQLHSCIIFLLDRLANTLRVEGISSKSSTSVLEEVRSVVIRLESLHAAGYSQSDLHQLKTTTLDEYVGLLEHDTDHEQALLPALRELRNLVVIQIPLFDSFRRLQGFLVFLREPENQVLPSEDALLRELGSKLANAFEIRKNIYFDTLTELPNVKRIRPAVVDRLISFEPFSLILCKIINLDDIVLARGDEIVDECMIEVTRRMKNRTALQTRNVLIGRNSGEASFIFVYPGAIDNQLKAFSSELVECVAQPITINGNSISLLTNIGICHSTDIRDTDMVFNYSKLAIQSISDQRNEMCIFNSEMQLAYLREMELEKDIREAVSRKQFIAHYQPKVSCDGTVVGYEALVRWKREDHIAYPEAFIDKVEKMGMIQALFDIVFANVCRDFDGSDYLNSVSVNIAPSQLVSNDLHRSIATILSHHHIEPHNITLEFVETAMLDSDYYNTIRELKKLGFRLSLDDFGTGYARYKTLLDLFNHGIVDEIKIDKVFTDDIGLPANQNFIKSICFLAREFNVSIIVEGVETLDQFACIKAIDPEIIIQGWLVSKALPLGELGQLYEQESGSWMLEGGV